MRKRRYKLQKLQFLAIYTDTFATIRKISYRGSSLRSLDHSSIKNKYNKKEETQNKNLKSRNCQSGT